RFAIRLLQGGTPVRAWALTAPSTASVQIAAGPNGELFLFEPTGVDVYDAAGAMVTRLALPDGLTLNAGLLGADGQLWMAGKLTKNTTIGPLTLQIDMSAWKEGIWLARVSPFPN